METTALALFWIALSAVVAPLLAGLVPGRLVPEVVLLVVLGVVIGPHVLGLASLGGGAEVLRELGLAMLFLLAGYEIDIRTLAGRSGRRALVTWGASLVLAGGLVLVLAVAGVEVPSTAVAIALTSTALGTLLPMLKEAKLLTTRLGSAVVSHGAVGELGPVVAMAVLLGSRSSLTAVLVLAGFVLVSLTIGLLSVRLRRRSEVREWLDPASQSTSQIAVRMVVLLLAGLVLLAIAFQLDVVLGAFAAGFILRSVAPAGSVALEHKLEGLAFGLLIPVFFVTSGMAIDPAAVAADPVVLIIFVGMLVLVRGVPVFLASVLEKDRRTQARVFSARDSVRIGLYGATGLPIIVAVTSVAVASGQMTARHASLLVAGGAVTVLVLPLIATVLDRRSA